MSIPMEPRYPRTGLLRQHPHAVLVAEVGGPIECILFWRQRNTRWGDWAMQDTRFCHVLRGVRACLRGAPGEGERPTAHAPTHGRTHPPTYAPTHPSTHLTQERTHARTHPPTHHPRTHPRMHLPVARGGVGHGRKQRGGARCLAPRGGGGGGDGGGGGLLVHRRGVVQEEGEDVGVAQAGGLEEGGPVVRVCVID